MQVFGLSYIDDDQGRSSLHIAAVDSFREM